MSGVTNLNHGDAAITQIRSGRFGIELLFLAYFKVDVFVVIAPFKVAS
jgi:hypothetical protein